MVMVDSPKCTFRYKEEPLIPENKVPDLVQWWDVSRLTVPKREVLLS